MHYVCTCILGYIVLQYGLCLQVRKEAETQRTGKTVPASKKTDLTTDVQGERMDDITNGASSLCISHKTNEPSAATAGVAPAALPKV